jgi:hypothetical protein
MPFTARATVRLILAFSDVKAVALRFLTTLKISYRRKITISTQEIRPSLGG